MQPDYAFNNVPQRSGKLNVAGVGNEGLVVEGVGMHLRGKRTFNLSDIATEDDKAATLRDLVHGKALALKPLAHLGRVGISDTELLAELSRRQPSVE